MATSIEYNEAKFAELVLYISKKCEKDPYFGAIKLNKVLFYADFAAYQSLGHSITGASYQKLARGPAPVRLPPVRQGLEASRRAVLRREKMPVGGRIQHRLIALDSPNLTLFTGAEIDLVNEVIDALWGRRASDVSESSHEFLGWQLADMNEIIPYETACLPDVPMPLTDDEDRWADEVAASL